ncbi:MAG: NADPH:quinone reductase [Acidobacteriota bacterium]|jgi:NADPH:quinone reductase-like Zn-dependent oxidoreductase|nr:NADPH:quinone reductase [Acidobacteriota bacterium]
MKQIPETMRVIELRSYEDGDGALALAVRRVPRPGTGQVLVRVAATPVNPSDLAFLSGTYGLHKPLPVVPGFEGSGEVVAAGGGLWPRYLLHKRVACAAPADGDGTWAEYMIAEAAQCIPLRRDTDIEQASMMIVNPFTAWALLGLARDLRAAAVVQTAAASALGRMVNRLAGGRGVQVVNIVRRPEQVALLEAEGAKYVLDSAEADFDERLGELCKRLRASVAFDAVAGEMTGRILSAMPTRSTAIVYGGLSQEPCLLDPRSFIFERKSVRGFWLADWLRSTGALKKFVAARNVERLLKKELRTEIRARLPLDEAIEGVRRYAREMTGGKIIFVPGQK